MNLKIISHRGNLRGPNPNKENSYSAIEEAIEFGFDVEVDVRMNENDNSIYLGHDFPQSPFDFEIFSSFKEKLWIHCKDTKSLIFFNKFNNDFNFFFHENDEATITSKGYIWFHSNTLISNYGILCRPNKKFPKPNENYYGYCTDYCLEFTNGNN